jgi:thioredoxin-like negative regulator of GroEL
VALQLDRRAEARHYYQQAVAAGWTDPELEVSLARLAMRDRQPAAALDHLAAAVAKGYQNSAELAKIPEFAPLDRQPAFQQLLKR